MEYIKIDFYIIVKSIAIISIWCLGFRTFTGKGNIGYFLRKPFEGLEGTWKEIFKPFILCVTCMASFHGIWIYIAYQHTFDINGLIAIAGASFVNIFVWTLFEKQFNGEI